MCLSAENRVRNFIALGEKMVVAGISLGFVASPDRCTWLSFQYQDEFPPI